MDIKALYQLVKKIDDDTFEVDHLHQYILSLQVGSSYFRFCVIDSNRNRCVHIEDYKFAHPLTPSEITEQLDILFDDHILLKAGFWKSIKLAVRNLKFSIIPNSLFSEESKEDYFKLNCSFTDTEELFYFRHGTSDTVNIFVAEKEIINWFKNQYPHKTIDLIHHTSLLIEGVIQNYSNNTERKLFVSVEEGMITIVVKKGFDLEFCNNFHFKTPNDFLYFVMFVYDELDLNPETVPVVLVGDIAKNSDLFVKLYKYVRNIHFGEKPNALRFGYKFDELQNHQYFDLYNMHLC